MAWKKAKKRVANGKHEPGMHGHWDKQVAAHYMTANVPIVYDTWTIRDVQTHVQENRAQIDAINYIYVVNAQEKLVGVVSIRSLFGHPDQPIKKFMNRRVISLSPDAHIEKVAKLALYHNLRAIPIIEHGELLGVIETQKILPIINRALHEHLLSFSGVHHSHLEFEDTMHVPIGLSIQHRIPWLIVGLFGVVGAAAIINQFEIVIQKHLILAYFIPAIVYMSGALGTQNQTLLVRDLATMGKELKLLPYFVKTITIGLVISLLIGLLVYAMTFIIWNETAVAFVIAAAMFATLLISSATSITVTLLFRHFGQDPAFGSGPFATVISDVSSLIIYFIIVSILL